MKRNEKFIFILSLFISLIFVALTLMNVEELGPYLGLYAISYFVSYRVLTPRVKTNLLGIVLLLLFLFISSMEVLDLIGFQLPKI